MGEGKGEKVRGGTDGKMTRERGERKKGETA